MFVIHELVQPRFWSVLLGVIQVSCCFFATWNLILWWKVTSAASFLTIYCNMPRHS